MSFMVNQKSFTNALTLFCLLVFLYAVFPDDYSTIVSVLRYIVIIFVIIILMIYHKILTSQEIEIESQEKKDSEIAQHNGQINRKAFKKQFKFLTDTVLSLSGSISENCSSAIYIVDIQRQDYILQTEDKNIFFDSVPLSNPLVSDYNHNDGKFYQKDDPEKWNGIFQNKNWRGSECAIFSPIYLSNNKVGFVLSMVEHFTELNNKNQKFHNQLGNFITFGIDTLGTLEERTISEENKSLILNILSDIDFKSDNQVIYNKFKFLIVSLFEYDRLTISIKKASKNRREYDKGLNLIIKIIDGDKDMFTEGTDFPTNGSLHGLPVIEGNSVITSNWQETHDNLFRFNSSEINEDYKSVLGVPIVVNKQNQGSILLERRANSRFSDLDEHNLMLIGNVLGSALYWKNEYEKIYIDATHDGLSGLLNHQTFKDRFRDEVKRAERFQQKMAIMIFDLDKFKKVNDTLGHQYGDYVIQTVAKIMLDNVRAVDVVARYGGEEFAIILINTTAAMSNVVAKRIVSNIADFNFSMDEIETRITISGGMSEYPTHTKKMKELIEYADQAMYETKQNGGNNITIHSTY